MPHVLTDSDGVVVTIIYQPDRVAAATLDAAVEVDAASLEPPEGFDPERHRHTRRLVDGQVVHELTDLDELTGQHHDPQIGARHA